MTAQRYFVILGAMRTGSNLLEQIIAGLPGTVCHGEVFNPSFIGGPRREDLLGWTLEQRDADPLGLLQAMREQAGDVMPGFRLFNGHSDSVLDHVLADPECARIVLRRDTVQSFVSLRIADATGQWVLRNPRRRRMARIRFDPKAYERYVSRLEAYYGGIAQGMAAAGTSALAVGYDELKDPALRERLARYLGLPDGRVRPPSLIRQNPEALRTKVANYAEMCTWLGREPVPLAPEPLPGPSRFEQSKHAPLAIAPIPGPGLLPLQVLLHRIDCREGGEDLLGRGPLTGRAERGVLFPRGPATDRHAFAVVARPDRRLKWLMGQVLFTGPDVPARLILHESHPDLPDSVEGWATLSVDARNAVFADFLDLVEGALADQADLPCPAAWRPQADLLASMQGAGHKVDVFPEADFDNLVQAVLKAGSLAPFPRGQQNAIASLNRPMPDEDPIPSQLSDRANGLHARDLEIFGHLLEKTLA